MNTSGMDGSGINGSGMDASGTHGRNQGRVGYLVLILAITGVGQLMANRTVTRLKGEKTHVDSGVYS